MIQEMPSEYGWRAALVPFYALILMHSYVRRTRTVRRRL